MLVVGFEDRGRSIEAYSMKNFIVKAIRGPKPADQLYFDEPCLRPGSLEGTVVKDEGRIWVTM